MSGKAESQATMKSLVTPGMLVPKDHPIRLSAHRGSGDGGAVAHLRADVRRAEPSVHPAGTPPLLILVDV